MGFNDHPQLTNFQALYFYYNKNVSILKCNKQSFSVIIFFSCFCVNFNQEEQKKDNDKSAV